MAAGRLVKIGHSHNHMLTTQISMNLNLLVLSSLLMSMTVISSGLDKGPALAGNRYPGGIPSWCYVPPWQRTKWSCEQIPSSVDDTRPTAAEQSQV